LGPLHCLVVFVPLEGNPNQMLHEVVSSLV
jgi:hypothetical protein